MDESAIGAMLRGTSISSVPGGPAIGVLPDNVLLHIFSFLSPNELLSAGKVSKRFRIFANISWKNLKYIDFERVVAFGVPDPIVVSVSENSAKALKRTHKWILQQCQGEVREMKNFGYCISGLNLEFQAPNLTHLHVRNDVAKNFPVSSFFPSLQVLEWENLKVKNKTNSLLMELTNLKKLVLHRPWIYKAWGLSVPKQIEEIHVIRVVYRKGTNSVAPYFPFSLLDDPPPSLKVLNVPYMQYGPEDHFCGCLLLAEKVLDLQKFVEAFPHLVYLDISNPTWKGSHFKSVLIDTFQHFTCMEEMYLNDLPLQCRNPNFHFPTSLRVLCLNGAVDLDMISTLSIMDHNLPNLVELSMEKGYNHHVEELDTAFANFLFTTFLMHIPNLERLTIRGWNLAPVLLSTICHNLKHLNYLDMSECEVDFAALLAYLKSVVDRNGHVTVHADQLETLNGQPEHMSLLSNITTNPCLEWITTPDPPEYRYHTKLQRMGRYILTDITL